MGKQKDYKLLAASDTTCVKVMVGAFAKIKRVVLSVITPTGQQFARGTPIGFTYFCSEQEISNPTVEGAKLDRVVKKQTSDTDGLGSEHCVAMTDFSAEFDLYYDETFANKNGYYYVGVENLTANTGCYLHWVVIYEKAKISKKNKG